MSRDALYSVIKSLDTVYDVAATRHGPRRCSLLGGDTYTLRNSVYRMAHLTPLCGRWAWLTPVARSPLRLNDNKWMIKLAKFARRRPSIGTRLVVKTQMRATVHRRQFVKWTCHLANEHGADEYFLEIFDRVIRISDQRFIPFQDATLVHIEKRRTLDTFTISVKLPSKVPIYFRSLFSRCVTEPRVRI